MSTVQDLQRQDGAKHPAPVLEPIVPDDMSRLAPPPPVRGVRRFLIWSFILGVVAPALVVLIYQLGWEAPRYKSETVFVLRGELSHIGALPTIGGSSSPSGALGALNRTQEGNILVRYIPSRAFIDDASHDVPIAAMFSSDSIDGLSRLPRDADKDTLTDYWQHHVDISVDPVSGILSLDVTAFSPDDAKRLATAALHYSELMLNGLLKTSRQDAVRIASQERERAAEDLTSIRNQIETFRKKAGALDPSKAGSDALDVIFERRTERAHLSAELQAGLATLSPNAPQIRALRAQIAAMDKQIQALTAALTKDSKGGNLAALISDYDTLDMKRQFADDTYTRSELTLMRTHAEIDSWHLYVIPVSGPSQPAEAFEPKPVEHAFFVFGSLLVVWMALSLIGASVMDHRQ